MEKNNREKEQRFGLDQKEVEEEVMRRYREESNGMSQQEKNEKFKTILFNLTKRYIRRFNLKVEQQEFSELMGTISKTIKGKTSFIKEKTKNELSENLQQKNIEDILQELSENEKEKLYTLFNHEKFDSDVFFEDLKYELQSGTKIDKAITKLLVRYNIFENNYKKRIAKEAMLKFFEGNTSQNKDIKKILDFLKENFKRKRIEKQMDITDFIK